jgi:hypothetical protein
MTLQFSGLKGLVDEALDVFLHLFAQLQLVGIEATRFPDRNLPFVDLLSQPETKK